MLERIDRWLLESNIVDNRARILLTILTYTRQFVVGPWDDVGFPKSFYINDVREVSTIYQYMVYVYQHSNWGIKFPHMRWSLKIKGFVPGDLKWDQWGFRGASKEEVPVPGGLKGIFGGSRRIEEDFRCFHGYLNSLQRHSGGISEGFRSVLIVFWGIKILSEAFHAIWYLSRGIQTPWDHLNRSWNTLKRIKTFWDPLNFRKAPLRPPETSRTALSVVKTTLILPGAYLRSLETPETPMRPSGTFSSKTPWDAPENL